jgi:hypothetical protein
MTGPINVTARWCIAPLARIATGVGAATMAVGLVAVGVMVPGCAADPRQGYSTQSTFPEEIRTVSVPIFRNYSTTPGIEAEITEAIIKEIQRSTPMKVVTTEGDSTLMGVITAVEMRRLSVRSGTGLVQELAVQLTVDFDWRDTRRGEMLASRRNFVVSDTFVPAVGVGERIESGQHSAAQRLAKDLVSEMRAAW